MVIATTLNRIRAHGPCPDGWEKLLAGLGKTAPDDDPLSYARIIEINGLDDALWACRAEPQHAKEWRLFAVWCARSVAHLSDDWRVINAICIAERHAHGMASDAQLAAARDAARAAMRDAALDTTRAAARAAAAWAAAWTAARAAAQDTTRDNTAWDAARAAMRADMRAATMAAQTKHFLEIVGRES